MNRADLGQTKKGSLFESLINIAVGIGISYAANQLILVKMFGYAMSFERNMVITGIFTVISIVRSFMLRRLFNWWTIMHEPITEHDPILVGGQLMEDVWLYKPEQGRQKQWRPR